MLVDVSVRAQVIVWTDRLNAAQDRGEDDRVEALCSALIATFPALAQSVLALVGVRACSRILGAL